jgi:hypothetical protein
MAQERFSVAKWVDAQFTTGKASRVVRPFEVHPGDRLVLCVRVSNRERRRNLVDAEASLRRAVESAGGIVVGVMPHVGSGTDPFWVGAAALMAKRRRATVLLAESTDRFVRNKYYHSVDFPDVQATEAELKELARCAGGMPLMTLLHPDASPSEVRSYQSKRGQWAKRRKGGRPRSKRPGYKKLRKKEKLGLVLWLHRRDWPVREIAAKPMVSVPKSTVHEWIHKYS